MDFPSSTASAFGDTTSWIACLAVTWVALMFVPILAVVTEVALWKSPPARKRRGLRLSMGALALMGAVMALGFSFHAAWLNFLALTVGYLAYGVLAVFACRRLARWLRMAAALLWVPVLLGYLLATVGFMGLLFTVGEYAGAPAEKKIMANGLECRITWWGAAFSDSGYKVRLYRSWPLLPLMEREVARIVVNESSPGDGPERADCDDALATLAPGERGPWKPAATP